MNQTGLRHCPPWFYAREYAPMLSQPQKASNCMLTVHRCLPSCLTRLVFSNAAMSLDRATWSMPAWMAGSDWERSILLRAFSILPVFWQEGQFLTGSEGMSMMMTLSMNACISGAWWRFVNYISANPPMECPIRVSLLPKPSFLMYLRRSSASSVMVCVGVCGLPPWLRASTRWVLHREETMGCLAIERKLREEPISPWWMSRFRGRPVSILMDEREIYCLRTVVSIRIKWGTEVV